MMANPTLRIKLNENSSFRFNYTDEKGKVINKLTYRFAKSFYDGNAFVYENEKWDIIDKNCESVLNNLPHNEIIRIALELVTPCNCFFIKNYRIADNITISVDFLRAKNALIKFNSELKWSFWNYSNQILVVINVVQEKLQLSFIEDLSLPGDGLIAIKQIDEKWKFVSIASFNKHEFDKPIFEGKFDYASSFVNGIAKVKVNGLFGFIDLTGSFVIPAIYDDARSFSEGLAAVAIANCRKQKQNKSEYYSDLRWNFIDKSNKQILAKTHEALSMVKDGDYYFYDSTDTFNKYNCACFDNEKMTEMIPFRKYGGIINTYKIQSHKIHWAKCEALGQLAPPYLIDLLTGQNSENLGFKRWFVLAKEKSLYAYYIVNRLFFNLPIDTLNIDFDTTQSEFDYINNVNSLELKYGIKYTSGKWKSFKNKTYFSSDEEFETDWSHYNDNLDMDQQSDEFWNQF